MLGGAIATEAITTSPSRSTWDISPSTRLLEGIAAQGEQAGAARHRVAELLPASLAAMSAAERTVCSRSMPRRASSWLACWTRRAACRSRAAATRSSAARPLARGPGADQVGEAEDSAATEGGESDGGHGESVHRGCDSHRGCPGHGHNVAAGERHVDPADGRARHRTAGGDQGPHRRGRHAHHRGVPGPRPPGRARPRDAACLAGLRAADVASWARPTSTSWPAAAPG